VKRLARELPRKAQAPSLLAPSLALVLALVLELVLALVLALVLVQEPQDAWTRGTHSC